MMLLAISVLPELEAPAMPISIPFFILCPNNSVTAGSVIYSANIAITGSGYAAGAAGHYDVNAYLWIDSEL